MAFDSIERIVEEAESDFHQIEDDFHQAEKLVKRIRKDLDEGELEIKQLMSGPEGDGALRAGANFNEDTLRRDISEIENDVRNLHMLLSEMKGASEKFAEIIGAWENLDAFKPE